MLALVIMAPVTVGLKDTEENCVTSLDALVLMGRTAVIMAHVTLLQVIVPVSLGGEDEAVM